MLKRNAEKVSLAALQQKLGASRVMLSSGFKGIVQRDLTGVETRLKRSALMNYIVAKFAF